MQMHMRKLDCMKWSTPLCLLFVSAAERFREEARQATITELNHCRSINQPYLVFQSIVYSLALLAVCRNRSSCRPLK